MNRPTDPHARPWRDVPAAVVVAALTLPLSLGAATAAGAPPLAGVLSGIVGGLVVGLLGGSRASVSGPAVGLLAVVVAQQQALGSYPALLAAVALAGLIQVALGLLRVGSLAAFIPTPVVKGLLAAVGLILVLKQIPHLLGRDTDPEGELSFFQPDRETTFTELARLFDEPPDAGPAAVGLATLAVVLLWERIPRLSRAVPAPLAGIGFAAVLAELLRGVGGGWDIGAVHRVSVPAADGLFAHAFTLDMAALGSSGVLLAAVTIAGYASLETLLSLVAVDRLAPAARSAPPNRELVAQGAGNVCAGLLGGLPVSAVLIQSAAAVNAGGRSRLTAVLHGGLLLAGVLLAPAALARLPLAGLAAVLLHAGLRLAGPGLVRGVWAGGRDQLLPFAATVLAILFTDLRVGALIGLAVSLGFVLRSNIRRPVRRVVERHLGGEVVRVELANQVSFLNRAAIDQVLADLRPGQHVLFDARGTDYIDPDVYDLIRDFRDHIGPARGVQVSLLGFKEKYQLADDIQYVDYSSRDIQEKLTPAEVLDILKAGHERFATGHRLTRDLGRQVTATAAGQHPLAVVLGCIDSRTPSELLFDLGVGDIFSARVAGNVTSRKVLGSIEYACAVAGAKLVLVLGHTKCGAVTAAVKVAAGEMTMADTGCQHIDLLIDAIRPSVDLAAVTDFGRRPKAEQDTEVDAVAARNVTRMVHLIQTDSRTIAGLVADGRIMVVGAMYDVTTGRLVFLPTTGDPTAPAPVGG